MVRPVEGFRKSANAGYFYPATEEQLLVDLDKYIHTGQEKIRAIGVVSPHAGYLYSGKVAGDVFSAIEIPETVIIIGPNHRLFGREVAVLTEGVWETPLGDVNVDRELANLIVENCEASRSDYVAHQTEHSLEVQIPFLRYLNPGVHIVPILLHPRKYDVYESLGDAIARSIHENRKSALIVASSDMTHYQPADYAKRMDEMALAELLALNPRALYDVVESNDISMCGVGPAVAMLTASKALGATQAKLVKYTNSGEVTGDYASVVGYAGCVVY